MKTRTIVIICILGVLLSSCGLNLNSSDGNNGGSDPDTTSIFRDASSNLPDGLSNITTKAPASDLNDDGDLDLAVAVASQPNKILINDGSGNFTDESSSRLPAQGNDSRDIAVADFNSDGNPDLFFAGNQTNELYINDGSAFFPI